MTNLRTPHNNLPIEVHFQQQFRWSREAPDASASWRIEARAPGDNNWAAAATALLHLLVAGGKRVLEFSPDYAEWQARGCDEVFRARRKGSGWLVESREWSGTRWRACDSWFIVYALGTPLRLANVRSLAKASDEVPGPATASQRAA
jgi:hypothetical protein